MTKPKRHLYLERLRLAAGHTQAQAARTVHVDGEDPARQWRRWENDGGKVPEAVVHLYAILTGQTYEPPP